MNSALGKLRLEAEESGWRGGFRLTVRGPASGTLSPIATHLIWDKGEKKWVAQQCTPNPFFPGAVFRLTGSLSDEVTLVIRSVETWGG